mmetsp:Transcript_8517/g.35073  ORF Transcript_8517/g.35073 Transcript_8517/m.35073 type:complete len:383 (-) Transcript_8517:701-1849(-)
MYASRSLRASLVSVMTRSACAICASVSIAASNATRSILPTAVTSQCTGTRFTLRFFSVVDDDDDVSLAAADASPASGAASPILASPSASFEDAGGASVSAAPSLAAAASPPDAAPSSAPPGVVVVVVVVSAAALAAAASSDVADSAAAAVSTRSSTCWTESVPWIVCWRLTRTRPAAPADGSAARTVNSASGASSPSLSAVIVKSSLRLKVIRFADGTSSLRLTRRTPFEPDESSLTSSALASSGDVVSIGAAAAADDASGDGGHVSLTANGAASTTSYALTLKRGESIAAWRAQPLETHSSALSVVWRPKFGGCALAARLRVSAILRLTEATRVPPPTTSIAANSHACVPDSSSARKMGPASRSSRPLQSSSNFSSGSLVE